MKFAKMFYVILVAIFSIAMPSANAGLQRIGCAEVNGVEVCDGEKNQKPPEIVGCATISDVEICSSNAWKKPESIDTANLALPEIQFEECAKVEGVDAPLCLYHVKTDSETQ